MRTGSVNLGQGFPDEDGPPAVIAEAVRALEHGANQYAPGPGVPALRQAIARHQRRHYGLELDPDRQVVVTTGCTEGIAAALLGLVNPGDEVVVLEPYYDSYVAMIQMAGGVRRPVTLRAPDFRLDVDALRAAVTPRTPVRAAQQPAQPDRDGARPGRAAGGRGPGGGARPRGHHRRGLRAPVLRRHRARADRHAAGDVRAHPDPVERRQVLLVHRLEGRLGDRPGRARGRGAGGQAVAHVHLRVAAPAGGGAGARRGSRTSRSRSPATSRSGATCWSTGSARPA